MDWERDWSERLGPESFCTVLLERVSDSIDGVQIEEKECS